VSRAQERRALVRRLTQQGYTSSRSIAKTLKEKHGIDVHHSTVARDIEQLPLLHTPTGEAEGKRAAMIERYDARVRDLSEMLHDKDLSKREKLAVHRTLNETEGKLLALRALENEVTEPGESEEARLKRNAFRLRMLTEMAEEHDLKRRKEVRAEIYAELREKGVEIEV